MGLLNKVLLSLTLLVSTNIFAAPSSLYSFVLAHPTVTQMESSFPKKVSVQLMKIEQIATYRCPNCYDFRLTYSGFNGKKPLKFSKVLQIRGTPENTIEVSVLKP